MELNIARLGPLVKQAERIADALEVIASLYQQRSAEEGYVVRPKKPVNDPVEPEDVSYTDDSREWLADMKKQYGVLSEDEKSIMRGGLEDETVKALEEKEQ